MDHFSSGAATFPGNGKRWGCPVRRDRGAPPEETDHKFGCRVGPGRDAGHPGTRSPPGAEAADHYDPPGRPPGPLLSRRPGASHPPSYPPPLGTSRAHGDGLLAGHCQATADRYRAHPRVLIAQDTALPYLSYSQTQIRGLRALNQNERGATRGLAGHGALTEAGLPLGAMRLLLWGGDPPDPAAADAPTDARRAAAPAG